VTSVYWVFFGKKNGTFSSHYYEEFFLNSPYLDNMF
jgi:hypothetical protein